MQNHSKIRYICLTIIFTIFSVTSAEAQLWGKLKNVVKKKAEEVVTEKVSGKPKQTAKETKNPEVQGQESKSVSVQNDVYEEYTANSIAKNSPEIVGLKLGMTPDQIVSALKARNKDYKIEKKIHSQNRNNKKILRDHEYVEFIDAKLPQREKIYISFSSPPDENFSTLVTRTVWFDENKQPSHKNVIVGLIKKYGSPTIGSQLWLYNMNGKLVDKNSEIPRGCVNLRSFRNTAEALSCNYYGLSARISENNDIVTKIIQGLINPYYMARNKEKTEKYIVDLKEAKVKKRKENANKVKVDMDF